MFRMCGTFRSLWGEPYAVPLKSPAKNTVGSPGFNPPSLPPAAPKGSVWHPVQDDPASVTPWRNSVKLALGLPESACPGTETAVLGRVSLTLRNGLGGKR